MEFLIIWLVFCTLVGAMGSGRSIGFTASFFISIFLSPLIGFIVVLCSKTETQEKLENVILNQSENNNLTTDSSISIADELEKLANLRDKGIISEIEFQSGKDKILNN